MADECGLAKAIDETETERHAALLASILSERLDVRLDVRTEFGPIETIRVAIYFDGEMVAEASETLPSRDAGSFDGR
jgi:hypothetical protein